MRWPRLLPSLSLIFSLLVIPALATDQAPVEKPAAKKTKQQLLNEFEAAILDPKSFADSLPERIVVNSQPEVKNEMLAALLQIKPHSKTQFLSFPKEQQPASVRANASVAYPRGLKLDGIEGEAILLLLINPDGDVANLFVAKSTHRDFAMAAALSLTRWKFKPARIEQIPVPVLFLLPVRFSLN